VNINWSKGLFRLWLICSIIWIALVSALAISDETVEKFLTANSNLNRAVNSNLNRAVNSFESKSENAGEQLKAILEARNRVLSEKRGKAKQELVTYVALGVLPISIVFLVGAGFLWAIKGFAVAENKTRKRELNND